MVATYKNLTRPKHSKKEKQPKHYNAAMKFCYRRIDNVLRDSRPNSVWHQFTNSILDVLNKFSLPDA